MSRSTAERALLTLVVFTSLLVGLTTATASTPHAGAPLTAPGAPQVATLALSSSIPAGAQNVAPRELVITAAGATLGEVTATGPNQAPLAGAFNAGRTTWTSAPLAYGAAYTASATGRAADGAEITPLQKTFTTLKPAATLDVASISPGPNQIVGIAQPISITFTKPVTDRAAVQRQLQVVTSTPNPGAFRWMTDRQVNWRPKEYWQGGTVVAVKAALLGVDTGNGVYGAKDTVSTFGIGRAQQVRGDVNKYTLDLYVDGKLAQTMPASYGRAKFDTQTGIHVIQERAPSVRMRSDSYPGGAKKGEPDYYDLDIALAVRISASGEYVHSQPATIAQQGRANVSHGCINLSPANAQIFYTWAQRGDPVDITGSPRALTPATAGIGDWVIPWEEYVKGSALPVAT